jgi:acetyl esterase/lipase
MNSKRRLMASLVIWAPLIVVRDTRAQSVEFDVERGLQYGQHDGVKLTGDLYTPKAPGTYPALVAVHGDAVHARSATFYRHWGPYLAQRGYVLLAIHYRQTTEGQTKYPEAMHDVRAGVQFLRSRSEAIKVDPNRIGLMGDSAGAHLAALVALSGDEPPFSGAYTDDPYSGVTTRVRVCVGIDGVYDLVAALNYDLVYPPPDNAGKKFPGADLVANRAAGFETFPLAYVTRDNSQTSFLLAWGAQDDAANPQTQSKAFLLALTQAGFFVRTFILNGAPSFRVSDPIDESGSLAGSFARRLVRFLRARL